MAAAGVTRGGAAALALVLAQGFVSAQELPLTHLTPEHARVSLPSASVQTVVQDSLGFIWLGFFSSGVARYDGRSLELYGIDDGLVELTVRQVVEDASGHLWVTSEGGLVVSERPLVSLGPGERVRFTSRVGDVQLPTTRLRHNWLAEGPDGSLWVAVAGEGLARYRFVDGSRLEEGRVAVDAGGPEASPVSAITVTRDGSVWVAREDGSIGRLARGGETPEPVVASGLPPSAVTAFHQAADGTLWVGCRDGQVGRLDAARGWRFELRSALLTEQVNCILDTSAGELWASSVGSGILLLEPSQPGPGRHFTRRNGLLSDTVWQFLEDREGNLWIAHNAGVSRLRPSYRAFTYFTGASRGGETPELPEPTAFSVAPPKSGTPLGFLWVGTGGGLAALTGDGSTAAVDRRLGLTSNHVYAITHDRHGRLWVGTLDGLDVLSPGDPPRPLGPVTSRRLEVHSQAVTLTAFGLGTVYAARVYRLPVGDGSGRTVESVWLCGTGGVICYVEDHWFVFSTAAGVPAAGTLNAAVDGGGTVFVGSHDSGVLRSLEPLTLAALDRLPLGKGSLGGREVTAPVFAPFFSRRNGAPSDNVQDLTWGGGALWLATGAGLVAVDPGSGRLLHHLDRASGLGGDRVRGLASSPVTHTLWATQNAGMAEVDPASGKLLRIVSKADGLVDNEVWVSAALAAGDDGTMYLATPSGLSVYRPPLDRRSTVPPMTRLRQLELTQDGWGNNELTLGYAALTFVNEAEVRYRTQLVGYDREPSAESAATTIRYTNLPAFLVPRTYTFRVEAVTRDDVRSAAPLEQLVTIRPAWWLSWWAVATCVLVIAAVGVAVDAQRMLRVRRRTRELEELVAARTRELEQKSREAAQASAAKSAFLAAMSHELRTPLNSIIGFSEVLIGKWDRIERDKGIRFLDNILQSGRHLLGLINDVLDLSKIEAGRMQLELDMVRLPELVDGVCALMTGMAVKQGIDVRTDVPRDLAPIRADAARVKQILYNLLSNAIKFSPSGGTVTVTVRRLQAGSGPLATDAVELAVSDPGIGIAPENHEVIFEEFRQLDSGHTRAHPGTGLGLALVRRFVELHGGRVTVTSALGQGSTFRVALPVDGPA